MKEIMLDFLYWCIALAVLSLFLGSLIGIIHLTYTISLWYFVALFFWFAIAMTLYTKYTV